MRSTVFVCCVLLILSGVALADEPATGQVTSESKSPPGDPVLADVVGMLDGGVSSENVLRWLEQSGASPGKLGPEALIDLSRAGATDELIQHLIELSPKEASPSAEPPVPAPDRPTVTPPPPTSTKPLPASLKVEFKVRYVPEMVEYQMTPWDLFVYVDGRPLVRGDGWASHGPNHADLLHFEESLTPGRHVIRILQEQHVLRSKRKQRWEHEARVFPDPIVLDLDADGEWKFMLQMKENSGLFAGGRVDYEIKLDRRIVSEEEDLGPSPSKWPKLCEEIETQLTEKQKAGKAGRKALRGCARWDALWEGVDDVPGREAVREEMQTRGFDSYSPSRE